MTVDKVNRARTRQPCEYLRGLGCIHCLLLSPIQLAHKEFHAHHDAMTHVFGFNKHGPRAKNSMGGLAVPSSYPLILPKSVMFPVTSAMPTEAVCCHSWLQPHPSYTIHDLNKAWHLSICFNQPGWPQGPKLRCGFRAFSPRMGLLIQNRTQSTPFHMITRL